MKTVVIDKDVWWISPWFSHLMILRDSCLLHGLLFCSVLVIFELEQKALDDAMIFYAQNGEAIRPEQGYPARLFLPGWEGNTSIKWIRRIEVGDQPYMTREETSKYTKEVRDGKIRQFSFDKNARSIITYPAFPQHIERGWIEIRGIAWSGRGRIVKVEVKR